MTFRYSLSLDHSLQRKLLSLDYDWPAKQSISQTNDLFPVSHNTKDITAIVRNITTHVGQEIDFLTSLCIWKI